MVLKYIHISIGEKKMNSSAITSVEYFQNFTEGEVRGGRGVRMNKNVKRVRNAGFLYFFDRPPLSGSNAPEIWK